MSSAPMSRAQSHVAAQVAGRRRSTIVFRRDTRLVVRTLPAMLWTWAGIAFDELDLGFWRRSFESGIDVSVLPLIVLGLAGFGYESYHFLLSTPRWVEIEGSRLLLRYSKHREARIELDDIREVRAGKELTVLLSSGEAHVFDWRREVRDRVLEALADALQLRPVPGDASGQLRRPLLYPGEPIEPPFDIPPGDRTCPRCQLHYPSHHWFVVDGPTREVICRPCAEGLDLERAETAASASRPPRRDAGGLDKLEA